MDAARPLIYKMMTASMVILTYFGARDIVRDVADACGAFFASDIMKSLTFFSIIFLRVEDIWIAVMMTLVFILFRMYTALQAPLMCKNTSSSSSRPSSMTDIPEPVQNLVIE